MKTLVILLIILGILYIYFVMPGGQEFINNVISNIKDFISQIVGKLIDKLSEEVRNQIGNKIHEILFPQK